MLSDLVVISVKGNSCHGTDTVQGSTKYASTLASLTCYSLMPATSIYEPVIPCSLARILSGLSAASGLINVLHKTKSKTKSHFLNNGRHSVVIVIHQCTFKCFIYQYVIMQCQRQLTNSGAVKMQNFFKVEFSFLSERGSALSGNSENLLK